MIGNMIRRRVLHALYAFEDVLEPGAESRTVIMGSGHSTITPIRFGSRVRLRGHQ